MRSTGMKNVSAGTAAAALFLMTIICATCIWKAAGAKAFCRTCRTYPRHIEEFEGLREISLSLSCPAVAEIILGRPEPVRFLHAEDPDKGEPQPDAYDDFDYFLFTKLEDAREVLFQILQDRAHPVTVRAAAALAFAHDLQEADRPRGAL